MRHAFSFVCSRTEVDPECKGLSQTVRHIIHNTCRIETPERSGVGVEIAGSIISSMLLVHPHERVTVIGSRGGRKTATVVDRDMTHFLVKLKSSSGRRSTHLGNLIYSAKVRNIGSLVLAVRAGDCPTVMAGGMQYVTRVSERKQDTWRMDLCAKENIFGSGVWNERAELLGLVIARKEPSPFDRPEEDRLPRLYAVPAEAVLEFAETN